MNLTKCYNFAEKSAHETTSDSDDGRHAQKITQDDGTEDGHWRLKIVLN